MWSATSHAHTKSTNLEEGTEEKLSRSALSLHHVHTLQTAVAREQQPNYDVKQL